MIKGTLKLIQYRKICVKYSRYIFYFCLLKIATTKLCNLGDILILVGISIELQFIVSPMYWKIMWEIRNVTSRDSVYFFIWKIMGFTVRPYLGKINTFP